ncbi:MAG: flagellar biosynthetic protein FliR [Phycisphaeraceae bacterium]|nr:flagellar biosynthetic protein FliR [Phycisphaeraceae bacterium]
MAALFSLHLVPFALVAFRVMGLFLALPLLGSATVPVRIKSFLAVAVAAAAYPVVVAGQGQTPVLPASMGLFALVPMIVFELAIGASLGFLAGMPLHAANFAGFLMGHQMGLGLARTFDPSSDAETDLLSQLLFIIASTAFLAIGGLDGLFVGVASSFERVPVGGFEPGITPLELAVGLVASGTELAVRVSAPVVGIVILVLVALGALSKTLPQLNVMTVGFIMKILLGFAMLMAGLASIDEAIVVDVTESLGRVMGWWRQVGAGAGLVSVMR